ncbi:Vacuolar protein sorting-associated protein 8 [Puccinia graminis f. sp. tritici]|uniref:Vacuolar protein sorting-associated protein 8 n=1 Tax=Puccinia graminis f. sp. tritici TaxID=56615 RepID=A0A5B0SKF4_PUCGR|nr:Vacuolar protein sorting-associated protein 8 [Puccinia graminis f. sp. tritici]
MESPTSSEEEFHRLRSSAQDENNKTFEQRFQDIFGQQQQDQGQQIAAAAAEEQEQDAKGGDVEEDEEEEEEEFIYDGQDVKLFDDEEDEEDQKDYATKLDEILRSNQLRHHQQPNSPGSMDEEQADDPEGEPIILSDTKTNGQDHPVLESFIELAESDDGSVKAPIIHPPQKPNLPILNHNHHQHQTSQSPLSPPVVIPPDDPSPSSSPSTSISQRIGFNRRSSSITPSHSITGSNTSSNLWFTSKIRPHNSNFSRLRSLRPSSTTNNSPSSLQLPNQRCVSSSTLASYHSYDDRSPKLRHQSEQPYSPTPSLIDRNISNHSNGLQSPSIIVEPDAQEFSSTGIFRWASLRRITQKIYSVPRRLHPSTIVSSANSPSNTLLGLPTVIATSGVIVVGTAKGWAMVFDYASNLKCVLGSDAVVRDAGAVSALSISHDHTFVAVGHIMGHIYLYDLAKPNPPTRTVLPTSLRLVQEGRAEGHLLGNRIIHIDFIGLRHTAIVSADETGLAFYHALGQVLGLASTDVIRILGKYPDQGTMGPQNGLSNPALAMDTTTGGGHSRQFSDFSINSASIGAPKSRKPTKIFGTLPLPLGPTPHPTDHHGLVALLTSSKLIIVALKPTPRTCWRCMRNVSDPNQNGAIGSLSWFPSSTVKEASGVKKNHQLDPTNRNDPKTQPLTGNGVGMDPLLAFSWGKTIRFVTVISDHSKGTHGGTSSNQPDILAKESFLKGFTRRLEGNFSSLRFVEGKKWSCNSNVLAIQWLSWRIICVLTSTHFEVIDTQIWQRTGFEPIDLRGVVRLNIYKEAALNQSYPNPLATPPNISSSVIGSDQSVGGSVAGSFKAYKGKIFLLTTDDLRLGMVVSWAEQILELVEVGSLTEAIDLTTSYWIGRADLETIGLPSDDSMRKSMVKPKLIEIMRASLEYVFSDRRMEDDTHFDLDGRGVDRTELFEGLVRSCAKASIAIGELDFIFDEMFEQYQEHGIETIFFLQLQPFILKSEISTLPTAVTQGLIGLHEDRKQFELIDQIIRRVDPACLDINQALAICSREMLHDALVYIYTEAMNDFVGPIVEFLHLIKSIHSSRQRIQQYCEDPNLLNSNSDFGPENPVKAEDRIEGLVPIAYKIFPYLSAILSGLSYPNKIPYEYSRASRAKSEVYRFLFSGKSMHWPQPDGKLILTTEEGQQEPTYPYLRMLLILDSEAMLDTLDIAFEDSWLHDYPERECEKRIDRQLIINLLLEVTSSDTEFSAGDRTFVYIFIARNLPKYSQFLSLPNSTLHSILIGLSTDDDRSTTEDRQLAVEFLLSVYTPPDVENGTGDLLELFKEAGFWRILTSIYNQKEMWIDVVHSQLKNPDLDLGIFDQLSHTLRKINRQSSSSKSSPTKEKDESIEVKAIQVLLNSVNQLIEINVPQTVWLVHKFRPETHLEVVERIGDMSNQFRYLRTLLEPSDLDSNDSFQAEVAFKKPLGMKPELYATTRIRYVGLLGKFDPEHVLDYLKSDTLLVNHTSDIVKICREEQIYDALVWQLDQAGKTRASFGELDLILKSQASFITKRVATNHDHPSQAETKTLDSYVTQLTRCAHTAAEICVERTRNPQDGLTGEDCWFYLLSTTVQCIQACASLLPPRLPPQGFSSVHPHRASGSEDLNSLVEHQNDVNLNAIANFQGLLPSIVSFLISRTTSSNRISFSNLVRRLIECSSTDLSTVESKSGSIPSNEFRSIILMIMDTYRFEGDVLEVTGRLIDEDLFEHVDRLAKAKEKGVRPADLSCFKCQKPILIHSHHRSSVESESSENNDGYEQNQQQDDDDDGDGDDDDGETINHPDRLQLIEKLGLPVVASVTPNRKQSIKGKEVEQVCEGYSSSSLSPSTFNRHPHYHQHFSQLEQSHDAHLGDSFLNRNPNPSHPNHLLHHPPSPFLLGPPPRAPLSIIDHLLPNPASPSSSPSRSLPKQASSPFDPSPHLLLSESKSALLDRSLTSSSSSSSSTPTNHFDRSSRTHLGIVANPNNPQPSSLLIHNSSSNMTTTTTPPRKDPLVQSNVGTNGHHQQHASSSSSNNHHHPPIGGHMTPSSSHQNLQNHPSESTNSDSLLGSALDPLKSRNTRSGDSTPHQRGLRNQQQLRGLVNRQAVVLAGDGKCFHRECWNAWLSSS